MRIIKNQKGFSLTEILIAVGLMGGVSLVTMKLVDDQASNEKNLKAASEVNKAIAMVQTALSGDASCKSLLKDLKPDVSPGATVAQLKTSFTRPDGVVAQQVILDHNKNYGAFFMKPGDIRFVKGAVVAGNTKASLVLTFRVRKGGMVNNLTESGNQTNNTIVKTLPIEFKAYNDPLNASNPLNGTVVSCGPVLSESNLMARKKFCASLDPNETEDQVDDINLGVAYWDGTRCKLNSMDCPYGEVPKEMTSLGGIHCVPLQDAINQDSLNQIIETGGCTTDATGVNAGKFGIEATPGGKLKLICY